MKPKFSKIRLNHKFIFGLSVVIIISSMVLPISVFGVTGTGKVITGTGKVTIVQPVFCGKKISQFDHVIKGTEGNDVLIGKKGNDLILGFGGDDIIIGGKGDDCLIGGDGNDIIIGGRGNDNMQGDNGNDILIGGQGNNVIDGGPGFDICVGGTHQNIIINCEVILKHPKNEFIEKMQHMIEQAKDKSGHADSDFIEKQSPKWFENVVMWWKQNNISDDDFENVIRYMIATN